MKIKNSVKGIKFSLIQILFVIFTAFAILIRTFQRFTAIEKDTGFYIEDNFINTFFTFFIIAVALILIVLSYLSCDTKALSYEKTESKLLFCISIVFALVFIFDFFQSMSSVSALREMTSSEYLYAEISEEDIKKIPFLTARGIFALLSSVYMFAFAFSFKSEKVKNAKLSILALMPVIWAIIRLFPLFSNEISYIRVSDLFMEIMMLAFMILFFFSLAQAKNGIGFYGNSWKLPAYGLCSAFLAGSITVPKLIATIINKSEYIVADYPFSLTDFVFFIFAVAAVCIAVSSERNEKELLPESQNVNEDK